MSEQTGFTMKYHGWGSENIHSDISKKPGIFPYLNKKLGISQLTAIREYNINQVEIPESKLPESMKNNLTEILGKGFCDFSNVKRITHSFGKSYKDLIRIRSGKIKNPPDGVAYPETKEKLVRLIQFCREEKITLIPFGGGTSVVSGVENTSNKQSFAISVDMSRMNKLLSIDTNIYAAEFEAGVFGPELERILQSYGFTLGHYPQSFEFSTLGGWIATRSSGQNSISYGGIEKQVVAVKLLNSKGDELSTLNTPRMACGPDFKELVLGSEGKLGIITSATVRISPNPAHKFYCMFLFPSFTQATQTSKEVVQNNMKIEMLRVSNEDETEAFMAMGKESTPRWKELFKKFVKKRLVRNGFDLNNIASIMIGIEGVDQSEVKSRFKKIQNFMKSRGGFSLGTSSGEKWLKDRFYLPYYRDQFLDQNIMVDTFETAATWTELENVYSVINKEINMYFSRRNEKHVLFTHLSHFYPTGASLYFSVLAQQDVESPLIQWEEMKEKINQVIKELHLPISHHHAVGKDHLSGLHWSKMEKELFKSMTDVCDPEGLFNPGKLCE